MFGYAMAYRFGVTPWEHYGRVQAADIAARLDREEAGRARPLGRALDLGCGRGFYTRQLARRGWQAVGIDLVPRAIKAAQHRREGSETYLVGDVTRLPTSGLGKFDFFLDIGCFGGLAGAQRLAEGAGVSSLAAPGATLLMLQFEPIAIRALTGGVDVADVTAAFPDWQLLSVEPANTRGLGWPLSRARPQWYRLGFGG